MTDTPVYLYVIQFSDGVVKVGQSRNLRQRIKCHEYEGRLVGRTVDEFDISFRYEGALVDERKLVAFCAKRWPTEPGHREYFVGADYDAVWGYFRELERLAARADWIAIP